MVVATLWLTAAIRPELEDFSFAAAMAVLGVGMGLLAGQLGNVAQSSVGEADRSEVGGLQYTAQNLGSSLGTAFVGSILLGALTSSAKAGVSADPAVSEEVQQQAGVAIQGGLSFVPVERVAAALRQAQVSPAEAAALVRTYADAQLQGLRAALLAAAASRC